MTSGNQRSGTVNFESLLDRYPVKPEMRHVVEHNAEVLKCIRGGRRMAEAHRVSFDPRTDYWHPPERRVAIAYLADQWSGRVVPAHAVRSLAFRVVQHCERARTDGLLSYRGVERDEVLKVCAVLAAHAQRLGPVPEWSELREVWPKLPLTAADHLSTFIESIPSSENWERGLKRRFPWFAYLGVSSLEEALARQAFFYGYANLWTTNNAYVHAGAQSFASVLQNTKVTEVLDYVSRWARGESPMATGFNTLGRDDAEPQNRAEYSTVIEVHGFLNLERAPFYNNLAETYREWFSIGRASNAYDLVKAVGQRTTTWIDAHPAECERLAALFRTFAAFPAKTRVEFEAIASPKVERFWRKGRELRDSELLAELDREARADLDALSDRDAAVCALHLLVDSELYRSSLVEEAEPTRGPSTLVTAVAAPIRPVAVPGSAVRRLPEGLRSLGERALAYLRADLHVLFAGSPGTGKTTLAQFIGFAWNQGLSSLPLEMPIDQAPLTTVGNSAWSPFHTIGGLVTTTGGGFDKHPGIFIDPASAGADPWRLRNEVIVLDEMNRADLDRCIGELYPLLSGSVVRVAPAGLPGVGSIEMSPRFRVIATVNDATIDDIVFPISEGLARRFQRIELRGASQDDVLEYLGIDLADATTEKEAVTAEATRSFFDLTHERGLLDRFDEDDRLPFGVAYFALLRSWLRGDFELSTTQTDATPREQARDLLAGSLGTLRRNLKWAELLRIFESRA